VPQNAALADALRWRADGAAAEAHQLPGAASYARKNAPPARLRQGYGGSTVARLSAARAEVDACLTRPSRLGLAGRRAMIRVSVGVIRCDGGESLPRRMGTPAAHFSELPRLQTPGSSGLDASRRGADVPPPPRSPPPAVCGESMSGPRRNAASAQRPLEKRSGGDPIGGGPALVPGAPDDLVIQAILYRPADNPSRSRIVSRRRRIVFPRVGRGAAGPTWTRRRPRSRARRNATRQLRDDGPHGQKAPGRRTRYK
jgi:hypothetical protein